MMKQRFPLVLALCLSLPLSAWSQGLLKELFPKDPSPPPDVPLVAPVVEKEVELVEAVEAVEAIAVEIGVAPVKPPMPADPDGAEVGVLVPAGTEEPQPEELSVVVKLRDGTIIVGQPVTKEFPLETRFGKLTIPADFVRSASFGLRVSAPIRKSADVAIDMLSSDDFKKRTAGEQRLVAMGPVAAEAVSDALGKDGLDPETLARLKKIGKQIAPEGFDRILLDGISAKGLTAYGRSTLETVDVDSSLGRLAIPIDKVQELRAMGSASFSEGFENFSGERNGWEFATNGDTVWHVSAERAASGKKCMRCSVRDAINYSDDAQAVVTSPPIDISGVDQPVLAFSFMLRMEEGSDFCYLELSKNGGKTWGNAVNFTSNGAWGQRKINLTEFRSEEFRFRFVFRSDGSNTDMGMHIDDLSVGDREML